MGIPLSAARSPWPAAQEAVRRCTGRSGRSGASSAAAGERKTCKAGERRACKNLGMARRTPSAPELHRQAVAAYVAAGGEESVQRVITAAQSLNKKLDHWYDRQLADLNLTGGEWSVVSALAKAGEPLTASRLADLANIAPSSMTYRLDKLAERGLLVRETDRSNRTRILVALTEAGWDLFSLAISGANVVESDVLSCLSDAERGELAGLLERVIAHLDEVEA
jgi:DNA-binding MarR family transcriptional regulator